VLQVLKNEIRRSRDSVLGIMDYRYAPLALGDTMTWLTNLQVLAHDTGLKKIELLILVDGGRSRASPTGHITRYNYVSALENIQPAFLCSPLIKSIRVYESEDLSAQRIFGAALARSVSWPGMVDHLRHDMDYVGHDQINDFNKRNGWIPKLRPPQGYQAETDLFRRSHLGGRQSFVLNIRQRALTSDMADVVRDSPSDCWYDFLCRAQNLWPLAYFVLVGDFTTWERRFAALPNVVIPRGHGYGLGHELSLLLGGMPFIGSDSGFGVAASFSDSPYVITRYQYGTTGYRDRIGLAEGEHYRFASANQRLSWLAESTDLLVELFTELWDASYGAKV
jgi:hypothetical protein